MEELVEKIIDSGIGGVIDKRTDALLLNDIEYQIDSANCRANDIYYMAGMRDAILFFNKAGLIKESL